MSVRTLVMERSGTFLAPQLGFPRSRVVPEEPACELFAGAGFEPADLAFEHLNLGSRAGKPRILGDIEIEKSTTTLAQKIKLEGFHTILRIGP